MRDKNFRMQAEAKSKTKPTLARNKLHSVEVSYRGKPRSQRENIFVREQMSWLSISDKDTDCSENNQGGDK